MSSQRTKRSRPTPKEGKQLQSIQFFDKYGGHLAKLWDTVLDAIDVSDLPIFRKDEPKDGSAFQRFYWMIFDTFLNKVRVVDDDEPVSDYGEEEEEETELGSEDSLTEEESGEIVQLEEDSEEEDRSDDAVSQDSDPELDAIIDAAEAEGSYEEP